VLSVAPYSLGAPDEAAERAGARDGTGEARGGSEMTLEELEARIRVLEDIEALRKLKATYCYLCDAGLDDERNRDELISHFSADAKVDFGFGPMSVFEGRQGLETFFGQVVPGAVSFCMHMVHNPIIEVNGDTATGRWYYEAPTTDAASDRAQWMAGTYEEQYVREDGEWKFCSIQTRWKYISPYDEGWARNPGELLAHADER
jgi:hypothetical protein